MSLPSTPDFPLQRSSTDDLTAEGFQESFGEDINQVLDVTSWRVGADLAGEHQQIHQEVQEAVEREDAHQQTIRERVFPRLAAADDMPKNAGKHDVDPDSLARVYQGLLFSGAVEACDGILKIHDTLPLTIYQIGVGLVSYRGDQGTWCQRLFRRDLRQRCEDPEDEVMQFLERRSQRDRLNQSGDGASGELFQRALISYAERAILLHRSQSRWRMGHGNPITYELLTGGSSRDLMVKGTNVLRELVEKHQRFVFVAREPREHMLLTLGHALRPLEYFIVDTLDKQIVRWFDQRRFAAGVEAELYWDDERISPAEWIPRFISQVASRIVVGLFRASQLAPAQLFYAHVDHADLAAHIVIADSRLQEQRGFPMLIDMANHVCGTVFSGVLESLTESAYAAAGAPWRYTTGRSH